MKKIMITGAGGFIGFPTVTAATKKPDWDVYAVVSGKRVHTFPDNVHVCEVNLSNSNACEDLMRTVKPDIFIHLAWELDASRFANSTNNLIWIENSLRLLRLFFDNGGYRFVFAGSSKEYGQPPRQSEKIGELPHRALYGEGKLAFEQISENYCKNSLHEFVSARIFTVYGPRDGRIHTLIPSAIAAFQNGQKFVCQEPNTIWDFIYVDDVANALVQIANSRYCGPVNVGSGNPHVLKNTCMEIATKMGCPELLSFAENEKDMYMLVADPTILNENIGYRCKVKLNEGLDRTITWWKNTQKEGRF